MSSPESKRKHARLVAQRRKEEKARRQAVRLAYYRALEDRDRKRQAFDASWKVYRAAKKAYADLGPEMGGQ